MTVAQSDGFWVVTNSIFSHQGRNLFPLTEQLLGQGLILPRNITGMERNNRNLIPGYLTGNLAR